MKNVALIPAAGRGLRMYPLTEETPKAMLTIDGKPLLQYNVELLRDHLAVGTVHIVIGEHGEKIREYFKDGSSFGVEINYIVQKECRGIGHAIGLGEKYIDRPFFVILGDEMYIDTNHRELLSKFRKDFNVLCAFKRTSNKKAITRNYTAEVEGDTVLSVVEKPTTPATNLLGVGTYAFDPVVFQYISQATPSPLRNEIEITDVIETIARTESKVYAFFLEGYYRNINTLEDLNAATYQWHSSHFDQYRISVIIPAFNEQGSIARVIQDFAGAAHEIVVVDNNSTDCTAQIARECGAKVVIEPVQGYGKALKRGMDSATGDIFILTEADATFSAKDLPRLLQNLKEADMVIGTRTAQEMAEPGATMDWFLRWGNIALGTLLKILWWRQNPHFSDVGCTYRSVWKWAYHRIKDRLKSRGPSFSVEMMIEMLRGDMKIIELPVKYYPRYAGESVHSSDRCTSFLTGVKMLKVIFCKWFSSQDAVRELLK